LELVTGSQVQADVSQCVVSDMTDYTAVVVCPKGLDQKSLRDAGVNACGDKLPCAAWIWDDPEKAPETAPSTPEKFTKDQVTSTLGIWISEKKQLIMISKVAR
jgi:hypothetical protein